MIVVWPSTEPLKAVNGNSQDAGIAANASGWPTLPPPSTIEPEAKKPGKAKLGTGRRLRLEKSSQVRSEMVRVYRELRAGEIEPAKATKLIYALTELSRLIEREAVEALEARLAAVERGR